MCSASLFNAFVPRDVTAVLDYFGVAWSPLEGPNSDEELIYLNEQHLFVGRRAVLGFPLEPGPEALDATRGDGRRLYILEDSGHVYSCRPGGSVTGYTVVFCQWCQQVSFGPAYSKYCNICESPESTDISENFEEFWKGTSLGPFVPPQEQLRTVAQSEAESRIDALNKLALEKILAFRRAATPSDLRVAPTGEDHPTVEHRSGVRSVLNPTIKVAPSGSPEYVDRVQEVATVLRRPPLFARTPEMSELEVFLLAHPNLREVVDLVASNLRLSQFRNDRSLVLPNLLLVGGPGSGKTSGAMKLARLLAGDFTHVICMGQGTTSFELACSSPQFRDANWGQIVQAMTQGPQHDVVYNPVVILDEIDKVTEVRQHSPLPALLSLLEPNDSQHFQDEYLKFPIDASGIRYLATANTVENIPVPLLSRFVTIHVRDYTPNEIETAVIPAIYVEWTQGFPKATFPELLSETTCREIAELAEYSPRKVEHILSQLAGEFRGELCPWPRSQS